jgi:(1->4)-alpha-D-glucan 1-alpha-D-glucosylmutase
VPPALASFPVYRTYVDPDTGDVDELDRQAVAAARIPAQLASILLLEERGHDAFVIRFQQTTPAVMAKGVEDTALYRYNALVCLNEVGGSPGRFSLPVGDFHATNLERARRVPHQLLATSTHDTKRSGDVRARIAALSWLVEDWRDHVLRWRETNAPLRRGAAPDANEEYLLYQTLIGAWPIAAERLEEYLEKALREAKRNTSWLEPNEAWESAVKAFARSLYDHRPFLDSFEPFADRVAALGRRIALGQTVLKLTCPGVPDIYNGDELWAPALVDPDNRRPVNWGLRRRVLRELAAGASPTEETAKLFAIRETLGLRARRPEVISGAYEPLDAGPDVCAFVLGGAFAVAVPLRPGTGYEAPAGARDLLAGAGLGSLLLDLGGR